MAGDVIVCTFINERRGSIEARVFNDVNGDGVQQSIEANLSNWNITFYNSSGTALLSAVTDASGSVVKGNLMSGTYKVCETRQAGWLNTVPALLDAIVQQPCHTVVLSPGQGMILSFGNTRTTVTSQSQFANLAGVGVKVYSLADINEAPTLDPAANGAVRIFLPAVMR